MMKRLQLFIAGIISFGVLSLAIPAGAYELVPACKDTNSSICSEALSKKNVLYGPDGIITKIANIIAIIVGIAAVIIIIIAGIQYMLSTGDPAKVNSAKNAIIYAVIGLIVVILARTLVVFFVSRLR